MRRKRERWRGGNGRLFGRRLDDHLPRRRGHRSRTARDDLELRFQVRDDRGDSWNVVYDLGTGLLDGRPTQEVSSTPTIELLESLHKQHHYPPSFAASSVWALFADLTAITLLFWCLSGLLMWWQMKKLRWVGASLLVLAVVVATLVMTSTAAEITFPPERAEGPTAPGGAPPGAFAQGLVEASRGV